MTKKFIARVKREGMVDTTLALRAWEVVYIYNY